MKDQKIFHLEKNRTVALNYYRKVIRLSKRQNQNPWVGHRGRKNYSTVNAEVKTF